ncbi:midasin [Tuber magnatum]|uniref:Midasin n=1 Tax=Tuber magnatum TaxID=42249 RepID=A0A317SVD5_9PEZI|nr:midasin [Tuber magnatum]
MPFLADIAEEFLLCPGPDETSPEFLTTMERLSDELRSEELSAVGHGERSLDTLLSLYRLLCFRRKAFLGLVDANVLYGLVRHKCLPIRYLSVRILSIYLGAADRAQELMFSGFGVGGTTEEKVLGLWEGREVDYGFLTLLEGERLEKLSKDLETARLVNGQQEMRTGHSRMINSSDLSPLTADLCGVLLPRLRGPPSQPPSIVDTHTTRKNISSIARALRSPQSVLITGQSGSGKTYLVHQIAHVLNNMDGMISIHLGDQTDAKLLIGAYTTAGALGSFEWRAGVLTTAVREGRWVVVEDIDQAPKDVLSVLLPLMERGELVIPSRGEKITAARGFKLIATIRTASAIKSDVVIMNSLGSRLWERVNVEMPSGEELNTIIDSRFPLLAGISPTLMDVYHAVQKTYTEPSFFAISKTNLGRLISPRDLMKWCRRIHALYISAGVATSHEPLSDGVFDEIFMEAVDCFAGSLQTKEARTLIVQRVASSMHIPSQRIDLFLEGGHIPGYSDSERMLVVGRAKLKKRIKELAGLKRRRGYAQARPFATTNHAARLLEQIGVAIRLAEPVLLVGETGTGKTTVVQQLADMMRFHLTVINLSQQTESGDLLGGFKPVDLKTLALPLKERFNDLFEKTFSLKRNKRFLDAMNKFWSRQQWNRVVTLWGEAVKMANQLFVTPRVAESEDKPAKKRKLGDMDRPVLQAEWINFANDLSTLEKHNSQLAKRFAFSFVEGSLVKAARNGDWVLLDEINLAAADTLESIADLLKDGGGGSILLSEKGDVERVKAHPDFRILACMNPATDVGKRDLPPGLRSRFTELYVSSPDQELSSLLAIIREHLGNLAVGDEAAVADIANVYKEAKRLSEEQQLVDGANHRPHYSIRTLTRTLSYVFEIAPVYGLRRGLYEGFCMSFLTLLDQPSEGILLPVIEKYILGRHKNVRSLISQIPRRPGANYVLFEHYWMRKGAYPIEEQPHYIMPPSVRRNMLNLVRATATRRFPVLIQGPTSSGKTSMIEYLAKITGQKFVRINNHEHTDLQEYLGSYISDDDGQLRFQEGILVKALREGHWIVLDELNLAPTDVLEALNRLLDDNRELLVTETQEVVKPHEDFMLFATQNPPGLYGGRKVLSRAFRNRFLELHFDDIPGDELRTILEGRCQIPPSRCKAIVAVYRELALIRQTTRLFEQKNSFATLRDLFRWANRQVGRDDQSYQSLANDGYMLLAERVRDEKEKLTVKEIIERVMRVKIDNSSLYSPESIPGYHHHMHKFPGAGGGIVWTNAMRRLYALVANALHNNEPVLLVGETGCGKTTVCQMLADALGKSLFVVNAHQNTETGDIIGAQRPIRNRQAYLCQLTEDLLAVLREHSSTEIADNDLTALLRAYDALEQDVAARIPDDARARIQTNRKRTKALFEWVDGSLIQAMKSGQLFLLDEISLADDSVLERLNSVLEPARGILLAEKGANESEITAANGFQFMATMNPGGDYGKKELSPALRNRFTEIWVPSMSDPEDILHIYARAMVDSSSSPAISIRDVLAWNPASGLLHGAALVFIDGIGANPSGGLSIASDDLEKKKRQCVSELSELCGEDLSQIYNQPITASAGDEVLQLGPFSLRNNKGAAVDVSESFNMTAPVTAKNAMRVVRAMHPGVEASGHSLTRINLSEQTDLMDLFGSDVPVEGGQSGEFAWRDAPFLRAMQAGHWSVLEGLNACLDHRGETYISELDLFAAQNPHQQGGGRKGLPASFVNRFTVVYVDTLGLNPSVYPKYVSKVIEFMVLLDREVSQKKSFASLGGPWEFNLRDTLRWLGLLSSPARFMAAGEPEEFLGIIKHRFRTAKDKESVDALFGRVFGSKPGRRHLYYQLSKEYLQVGHACLSRRSDLCFVSPQNLAILKRNLPVMETIMTAIVQETPCILVGPSGVGKSSLLKLLASIAGVELDEIAINSDIDATDIVGGFEQVDVTRKISKIFAQFDCYLKDSAVKYFCGHEYPGPLQMALALYERIKSSNARLGIDSLRHLVTELRLLEDEYGFGMFYPFINNFEEVIAKAHEATNAGFEWVDGMLIDAIEQGRWLVLDNANLCSPSVLDRLNSLLEPNGCLIVSEHNDKDGRPKIVHPRPGFRLFLTMDPDHGELSRAMRNRGIEVFMDPPPMDKGAEEDDRERKEIAKYSPSTESSMGIYRIMSKLLNNDIDTLERTETDMALLSRWRDHIGSSSTELTARRMGILQDAVNIYLDLYKWVWPLWEDRMEYHAKLLSAVYEFKEPQPINLPRNTPLMSLGAKASDREAGHLQRTLEWTAYMRVYDCMRGILEIGQVEEGIIQKATATTIEGLRGMRFLEISASKQELPPLVSKANLHLPIFEFLSTVREELYNWADTRTRDSAFLKRMCEDKKLQNSLLHILELLRLWHDIVILSNAPGNRLDESVLYVYVELFEEWAKSSGDILPPTLMQPIGQALDGFRAPFQLITGFSMELMWNAMRPSVPASLVAWTAYDKLKEIADRFDAVTLRFKGSFEVVAFLKGSLITALTDVLTLSDADNIRKLIEGLEAEIARLEKSQALTKPEQPELAFRASFDYLFRFRALRVAVHPNGAKALIWTSWLPGTKHRAPHQVRQSAVGQMSQLNIDLKTFSKQLFLNIRDVTSDRALQLTQLLVAKIHKIITLHAEFYDGEMYAQVTSSFDIISRALLGETEGLSRTSSLPLSPTSNDKFRTVVDAHFTPAIGAVCSDLSQFGTVTSEHLGSAWAHYALGCLKLYVPSCAFDPAMKFKGDISARIEAENIFESRFTGQANVFQLQYLRSQIEGLGVEPPISLMERPEESKMAQLQGDFSTLLKVVVQSNLHERLLPSILGRSHENLSQIAERLKRNYTTYKDLVDPVLGFLYSLKLGLGLAAIETEKSGHVESLLIPDVEEDITLDHFVSGGNQDDAQLFLLWRFATRRAVEGFEGLDKKSHAIINRILFHFFDNWKAKTVEEQEKAVADASLYRYEGGEEGHNEQGPKAMFPDYEREVENAGKPAAGHRYLAVKLAECHSALYLPGDNLACDLASLIRRGVSAFVKSVRKTDGFPAPQEKLEAFLPAIVLSLSEASKWIDGREEKPSSKTYDFYTDENLAQAQRLVDTIEKCQARLQILIDTWPENVTLQDALGTCQEILSFPNDSPVAKFLPKIERLHESLNEWQSVASSQYSVTEHYDALTQLIINWRRLELTTWPRLFDLEDEKCRVDADSWWFYVFENVIANPARLSGAGEHLNILQLVSTLSAFIASSSIGQFPGRLHLLQTFEKHVLHLSEENSEVLSIQKGLKNLITYYSQYVPMARDFLIKQRKTFEKMVSEVALLASWKDTNIIALRDSAKRSHYKLYKVVKKYREALARPIRPLIEGGMPSEEDRDVISVPGILPQLDINIELVKEIYEKRVQRWDSRPTRLTDPAATVQMMQRVSQSGVVDVASWLKSFSTSIISIMKELQAETPGTLTETNKPEVKHLKTRKRKAFTDTLKELRHMGLKSNLSSSQLQKQSTLEAVLTATETVQVGNDGNESCYFLRVLELLPKIRRSAAEPTPDLTGPEVARSVGYIEHMFSMILEQRDVISSSLRDLRSVQRVVERYKALSNLGIGHPDLYGNSSIIPGEYFNVRKKFLWLPETLGLAIELLRIHTDFSGIKFEDAKVFFEKSREVATNLNTSFKKELAIHDGVWEHSAMTLMDRALGSLRGMNSKAENLGRERPEISYIIHPITSLLSLECQPRAPANADPSVSLQIIDASLWGLCDQVFVSLQKLKDSRTSYPPSPQKTGWLAQCHSASASNMRSLHMGDITLKAAETLSLVSRLQPFDTTTTTSQAARALFAAYYPIVQEYTNICQEALQEALGLHYVTSRTAYILCKSATTLLTKGFCMPEEEQSEEAGGTNGLESGTGLGEGEGADDISKDIKADEDLSDLAQEKNREEREKEIENEKDAVDIEGEMEGELDDMSSKGEDDDGEGSSNEKEDDMDEETGDVDDLGATAVDEKLWDGKGEDNAKEKEGGETRDGENRGENIEAKKESNENQHGPEGKEGEPEIEDASDGEGEGADEEDEVRPETAKGMDSHDLELDGDEKGNEDSDLNTDDLSDVADEEEPMQKDEGKDWKKENPEDGEQAEESGEEVPEDHEQNSPLQTYEEQNEAQAHDAGVDQQDSQEAKLSEPPETNGANADQEQGQKLGQASRQDASLQNDNQVPEDEHLKEEQEPFRKVGDVLEKWHRNRREILGAHRDTEHPQVDNMELDDPEFEHLPDEETATNTQALGAATEEQAHSLDDLMAIDSGTARPQETLEDVEPDPRGDSATDDEMKDSRDRDVDNPDSAEECSLGAIIGNPLEPKSREQILPMEDAEYDLDAEDMDMADKELEGGDSSPSQLVNGRSWAESRELWRKHEQSTKDLSMGLCEQLRLILEPTLATKMRGDFRTGKRLNMRRIIPYIASQYKKDKIWMRRTKPSKRQYQVMIALDDSKSMAESNSVNLAFETVTLVAKALSQLEAGQISIVSFGEITRLIHPFEHPFTSESGAKIFQSFTFDQPKTNVKTLVEKSLSIFESARTNSNAGLWQLEIIVSDGVCEDHDTLRRLVRKAQEEKIMIVFVIVDSVRESSILVLEGVRFERDENGGMELKMYKYLDSFPFGFYLVVSDIKELPGVLALALRQWLAEIVDATIM